MNLSISSFATIPSTGGLKRDSLTYDSILVSYDDLRKANSKLIELEYEKTINEDLRTIITNDSIAIDGLRNKINTMNDNYNRTIRKYKTQRNVAGGITIGALILLIISIL